MEVDGSIETSVLVIHISMKGVVYWTSNMLPQQRTIPNMEFKWYVACVYLA
jgi:hypothetical protein